MDKDYKKLNSKEKEIVEMYITARQFKNAILINEMVTLPNNVNGELTKQNRLKYRQKAGKMASDQPFPMKKSITLRKIFRDNR